MNGNPERAQPAAKRCAGCGASFGCGATLTECWCQALPPLDSKAIDANADCWCPACLRRLIDTSAPTESA